MTKSKYHNKLAFLLFVSFVFCAIVLNLITRLSGKYIDWISFLTARTIVTCLISVALFFVTKSYTKSEFTIVPSTFFNGILNGVGVFLWYKIAMLLPMNLATIVSFVVPIAVSFTFSFYGKEKFSILNALFLIICFFAVFFCFDENTDNTLQMSTVIKTIVMWILIRIIGNMIHKHNTEIKNNNVFLNTFTQQSIAVIAFFVMSWFYKNKMNFYHIFHNSFVTYLFISSIVFSLLQSVLLFYSYKMSNQISKLQLCEFLKLPMSFVLSMLFLHEQPTIKQFLAGITIISINVFSYIRSLKK